MLPLLFLLAKNLYTQACCFNMLSDDMTPAFTESTSDIREDAGEAIVSQNFMDMKQITI